MANVQILSKIILRNDTAANWIDNSTKVLLKGEVGLSFNTSTGQVEEIKVGNGVSTWAQLPSETTVLKGSAVPTSSTKGFLGQLYIRSATGSVELYQCTVIDGVTYTWAKQAGTQYSLGVDEAVNGVEVSLTGSDSTEDKVTFKGAGATTVALNEGEIVISSTDNDTKVVDVTDTAKKVLTGLSGNTTLSQTTVESLVLGEYARALADGSIVANDTLQTAFSRIENEIGKRIPVETIASVASSVVTGYNSEGDPQWTTTSVKDLLLAGYIKSADTGSIVETDTLLKALSRLENALAELADGMVYAGKISGGDTGSYGALTPFANMGHTYKVDANGKINGVTVHIGDLLICNKDDTPAATALNYEVVVANWDLFSFDSSTNVMASSILTKDQLVLGDTGARDLKTMAVGSAGQILKVVSGIPAWATETDTYINAVSVSDGINASISENYKTLSIGITSISTDLLVQGSNTLIMDGGNSSQ